MGLKLVRAAITAAGVTAAAAATLHALYRLADTLDTHLASF